MNIVHEYLDGFNIQKLLKFRLILILTIYEFPKWIVIQMAVLVPHLLKITLSTESNLPQISNDEIYFNDPQFISKELLFWQGIINPPTIVQIHTFINSIRKNINESDGKIVNIFCSSTPEAIWNYFFLLSSYLIVDHHLPSTEILSKLKVLIDPFQTFEKVQIIAHQIEAIILNFSNAFILAYQKGFYNPDTFPLDEYNAMFSGKNGDMNWIIYKRLLALASPISNLNRLMAPKLIAPLLKGMGIKKLIRLCQPLYSEVLFNDNGIECDSIQFPDGGVPDTEMIQKWIQITSDKSTPIAVHCMAGIGRTGTMCAIYLMKYEGFKAEEAFWYIRTCRSFSIESSQLGF